MYGAVLGKHKRISLKELELVQPQNLKIYQNIALFDTDAPEKIEGLAGIIKRGKIITSDDIQAADIIGTNSRELGKVVKKQGLTRRFKDIDETKTDEEIRSKGKEYIVVDDDFEKIIAVEGYQSIALYESVDFEKPVNSMKIGMMPAKLTQMMINIGLANISPREDTTIYDPFVGLGTTAFLVNHMGYDCIVSDIDMTSAKQNIQRRGEQTFAQGEKRITTFKHDIVEPLKKPFLHHVNLIVTEGWLGPIITEKTGDKEIYRAQDEIIKLYKAFFANIDAFYEHITVVCTIPIHQGVASYVQETLEQWLQDNKLHYEFIKEVYKRAGQKVGRQIVIIKK